MQSAVQILNLIQEILPHVAALNLLATSGMNPNGSSLTASTADMLESLANTTSQHYTWVQSEHPYKPASVSNYRVAFSENVKWMSIEFDPACSTSQPEDSLQLYVPSINNKNIRRVAEGDDEAPPLPYWPILHKFTSSYVYFTILISFVYLPISNVRIQWPPNAIILPGHEVIFSLETASDYLKDDRASSYGFKCMVVGYEWPPFHGVSNQYSSLKHMEAELSFLGGMCAASLIKKDLQLPTCGCEL